MGHPYRILLIEPAPPGFHVFSKSQMPRLGLPLLGAILRERGHEVRIHLGALGPKALSRHLDCDLVGLSTTTSTALEAYRLADQFRALGKTVVIGGVHASFLPEEALEHADFAVRGEAEESFPALLDCLAKGVLPEDVPGISYRRSGEIVHNPDAPLLPDLDRYPFPDFGLITSPHPLSIRPLQTSRGCPFPCNFCSVTRMFGRKVRFRSVESVLEELRRAQAPDVFFYDDNFCAKPEYTRELLTGMLERGLKPKYFEAQVRADVTRHPDLVELMARAGCCQVYVGFESINPESLKAYDKRQSPEEIETAMEVFHKHKIRVHGMFVIGSDFDTRKTARETLRFVRRRGVDTIQFMMLTPLPGTDFFRQLEAQGRILTYDWSLYDGHHAVFLPRRMSPVRLQKTTIRAMSRFYTWREGLKAAIRMNKYQVNYRLMGWYIIRRWKWDNRGWLPRLKEISLKTQRDLLNKRLAAIRAQLDEALAGARAGLPHLQTGYQEAQRQVESYRSEAMRLAGELMSARRRDLAALEKRTEELAAAVRSIIEDEQRLGAIPMAGG
ncbi:MAG: radical SAM protein [Candidatus Zixiibacteriota bacterium]|nr:MAG: radical SAM protein [candidate division Zixibacteria bacterium]